MLCDNKVKWYYLRGTFSFNNFTNENGYIKIETDLFMIIFIENR